MRLHERVLADHVRSGVLLIDEEGRVWKRLLCGRIDRRDKPSGSGGYLHVRLKVGGVRYGAFAHCLVWQVSFTERRGADAARAVLTAEQSSSMRTMAAAGASLKSLASAFAVSLRTVSRVLKGKRY